MILNGIEWGRESERNLYRIFSLRYRNKIYVLMSKEVGLYCQISQKEDFKILREILKNNSLWTLGFH